MDYKALKEKVGDETDLKKMRPYVEEIVGCQLEDSFYREVEECVTAKIKFMKRSDYYKDFAYCVLLTVDMVKQVLFSHYTRLLLSE